MTAAPQPANPTAVPKTITVAVAACCGALEGDYCDCAEFAADAARHFQPDFTLRRLPALLRQALTQDRRTGPLLHGRPGPHTKDSN